MGVVVLSLTEVQKKKVEALNETSFRDYCNALGYDVDEHKAFLLAFAKRKLKPILAGVTIDQLSAEPAYVRAAFKAMKEGADVFEMRDAENECRRQEYGSALVELAHELPIAYNYAASLCRELGLPEVVPGEPASLTPLIQSVPISIIWPIEFNAFVTSRSEIDGLPCIQVHEFLLTTCDTFLECVAPTAWAFAGRTKLLPFEENVRRASTPRFRHRLQSCINTLLGRAHHVPGKPTKDERNMVHTLRTMVEGSIQMVWFHEFGHLLRGHLEQLSSHKVEFEADQFALSVISKRRFGPDHDIPVGLGALTVFVLMDIMEAIFKLKESASHPPAKQRLRAAMDFIAKENLPLARKASGYLWCVAAVCNPTLEKVWNVSIDYDEFS